MNRARRKARRRGPWSSSGLQLAWSSLGGRPRNANAGRSPTAEAQALGGFPVGTPYALPPRVDEILELPAPRTEAGARQLHVALDAHARRERWGSRRRVATAAAALGSIPLVL